MLERQWRQQNVSISSHSEPLNISSRSGLYGTALHFLEVLVNLIDLISFKNQLLGIRHGDSLGNIGDGQHCPSIC